jgi:hypothetical protein
MKLTKLTWTLALILLAAALTSCNIGKSPEPTADVNAIYTSAAQTMVAGLNSQLTQTAQAAPPTATYTPLATGTLLPTFAIATGSVAFGTPGTPLALNTLALGTPQATLPSGTGVYSYPVGCNDATFIGETKPLDGTLMTAGKLFDKGWSLLNTGTCTWDEGYSFAFKSGDRMQGNNVLISASGDFTKPQHSQAFVVKMQVPNAQGQYKGFWQMKDDQGNWFGSIVYVDISVGSRNGTATPTATNSH